MILKALLVHLSVLVRSNISELTSTNPEVSIFNSLILNVEFLFGTLDYGLQISEAQNLKYFIFVQFIHKIKLISNTEIRGNFGNCAWLKIL